MRTTTFFRATFDPRRMLCLYFTDLAIQCRKMAVRTLPANHPVRRFEEDMIRSLQDAERSWFQNESSWRKEKPTRESHRLMWVAVASGALVMILFNLGITYVTGTGPSTRILRSAHISPMNH